MIIYSVTITLAPEIEAEWLKWMREFHITDVLKTDCFLACRIYRAIDTKEGERTYVMQYQSRSLEDYHRYRDNFAAALQKDHSHRFAGRFQASRQILELIEEQRP